MNRRSLLAAAVAAWLAPPVAALADPGKPARASLYDLEGKWTDEDGASVTLSPFAGKLVVLAMG
jgi:uncharacterized protein (DUF2147 family)